MVKLVEYFLMDCLAVMLPARPSVRTPALPPARSPFRMHAHPSARTLALPPARSPFCPHALPSANQPHAFCINYIKYCR